MATEPERLSDDTESWNYFSYYTEIEEHFQRARGTGLFLLSPLDWALVETWKNAGVPLEAALRGIDSAFEKWHERKHRFKLVNSLAYCAQAVHEQAQQMAGLASGQPQAKVKAPFAPEDVRKHLESGRNVLRLQPSFAPIVEALDRILGDLDSHYADLEQLEQRLTALEDKMSAIAKSTQTEEQLFQARRELDAALRPYRGKMTTDQLTMLERQFLEKRALENASLPRLSLFYLQPDESTSP